MRTVQDRIRHAVLFEAIERRAQFFETLSPFKTAMDVLRHRSRPVATMHRRMAEISRNCWRPWCPSR